MFSQVRDYEYKIKADIIVKQGDFSRHPRDFSPQHKRFSFILLPIVSKTYFCCV